MNQLLPRPVLPQIVGTLAGLLAAYFGLPVWIVLAMTITTTIASYEVQRRLTK